MGFAGREQHPRHHWPVLLAAATQTRQDRRTWLANRPERLSWSQTRPNPPQKPKVSVYHPQKIIVRNRFLANAEDLYHPLNTPALARACWPNILCSHWPNMGHTGVTLRRGRDNHSHDWFKIFFRVHEPPLANGQWRVPRGMVQIASRQRRAMLRPQVALEDKRKRPTLQPQNGPSTSGTLRV